MSGAAGIRKRFALTGLALIVSATVSGAGATTPATNPELARQLLSLEQRATRAEDVNAIKRLQRSWGYYLDKGLWDEAANLFSDEGSIEMGLDGVYAGRKRVREYLYAWGGGRKGLAAGQLNEHLTLMPVVDLSADGLSARGTWRDVLLIGQLGKDAYWGEGPYVNDYVKENGVWKIRRLHWFQTLYVPYEGGWSTHGDVNAGHLVGDRLKSDAPPTITYKTWPGAFTPPFHFKGAAPVVVAEPKPPATPPSAAELARRTAQLAADVQQLDDQYQIENLQRIYGYYIDKAQWSQAAALFAAHGEVEIAGRGIYRGKEHVLAYLRAIAPEGALENRLYDNMQLQPVIHVAADGRSAKGRWRLFAQLAQAGQFHEWGTGVYENEYVREDGVWKIRRLHLYPTMYTPYEDGWGKISLPYSRTEPTLPPDAASGDRHSTFEQVFVPPFHYAHPVTGARLPRPHAARPAGASDEAALAQQLQRLQQQLAKVEDVQQIENLQMTYGYYLATLQWDSLTDLFEPNGTIEIALRGVYVGKASVRRNLDLYGQAGLDDGVLHNHMQYQPVIHVAPDGQTAMLRSRAFSMMGNFGKNGTWMGGVYENQFVKIDGRWRFHKDQVMNTYFAPYETGWKELKLRPAPGITASNPPDRPPSFPFDLYPKNFLPPYHYANPVTGR
jgi:hypothetical protein